MPEGLSLPQDANTKPFKLDGLFIAVGNSLMPLQLGGMDVPQGGEHDEEGESEGEESEEGGECCPECGGSGKMGGMGGMDSGMGGDKGMSHMGGIEPKGNSFMIAIERSMKKK